MKYYKTIGGRTVYFSGGVLRTTEATIINPTHEYLLENGWLVYEEPEVEPVVTLESLKEQKLFEIINYDNSSSVNEFYLSGMPMWLDAPTRQTLRISIDSYAAMGIDTVTKWFGGQEFTFHTDLWLQMLNALEVYAAEALNVTEAHRAAINASDDMEFVENFDITADYPEKLNFDAEWVRSLSPAS